MNFIGKILVVIIFVLSILFMFVGIQVYATHRNWEQIAKTRESELTQTRSDLENKIAGYNRLDAELKGEIEARSQQIRKLESERELLESRNATIQQALDQRNQENREAIAALDATQKNNARLVDEVDGLRGDIRTTQTNRDELFVKTLDATEELHAVRNDLELATERTRDLLTDTARMSAIMEGEGLDPQGQLDAVKPRVDGMVSATGKRSGETYVELTIGADDGLKVGHTVEVFREGGKYLGRVEITKTYPDRAVGKVDKRYQQGPIQENDRVATRLDLS